MEEDKTGILQQVKNLSKNKPLFIGGLVFFTILVLITGLMILSNSKKDSTKKDNTLNNGSSSLPQDNYLPQGSKSNTPSLMTIGRDRFSKADIEYVKSNLVSNSKKTSETELNSKIQEKAIVLQEAKKMNLIPINDTIFSPNKDWPEYNKAYEEAKNAVLEQIEQASIEGIFLWFNVGNPEPVIAQSEAKEITRKKIDDLRSQVISKKITFLQAVDVIKSDSSLAEIDPIYINNAYAVYEDRDSSVPIDAGLSQSDNSLLWSLKTDEFSPVLLGFNQSNNIETPEEGYWAFYHVINHHGTILSYDEWLKQKQKEYAQNI